MCGRMACNLCREDYQNACNYFDKQNNKYIRPQWIDLKNGGSSYRPSNNICPSEITPVLVSGTNFSENSSERCIAPMMWGLVPRWHKGEAKKHGLLTNNCRLEGIQNLSSKGGSKLYASPLKEGKRCVVLCEGYYEWQTKKDTKNKQPYYIYAVQKNNIKVEEPASWKNISWNEQDGWCGPVLLKLAAVYDVWNANSEDQIYSYSIITMSSNESLSWLHNRMPAILNDESVVQDWLDTERVSSSKAISLLKPVSNLMWHPVSTVVNNSRNKDSNCNKPLKNEKTFSLKNWLQTGKMLKRSSDDDNTSESKKFKE